jgi:hypothetical protein
MFRCDLGEFKMLERLVLAIAITFLFYLSWDNSSYRTTSISSGVQLSASQELTLKQWR